MVRIRWSALLGLSLIAPLVWSAPPASAGTVATGSVGEVRVARPAVGATGQIDAHRTQALRTDLFADRDAATDQRMLRSGANLVAHPELGPTSSSPIAANLQFSGYTGRVRIGVIDFFSSTLLNSQAVAGELNPIPSNHRKCLRAGKPCSFSTSPNVRHGNAMAEIISDEAPGAELFVAQADTIADYRAIIDWFALNGVKIVNHSLIGNYDGPGNGTGPQASVIDYAVSKGMAWFNAAGDMGADTTYAKYAGGYWRGTWSDPDNDGWLNFKGTDETLGSYCGALLGLRWSDWGTGRTDYELWVNDVAIRAGTNGTAVLLSNRNQAGTPAAAPIEGNDFRWLCNTNAALGPVYDKNKDGFVALKVKRSTRSTALSSKGDRLEIQVNNGYLEYAVDGGSVGVGFADTKNPGAATIGHLNAEASHGPTNDGRIKPDLVTDGCSPTSTAAAYGECTLGDQYLSGDSAAAKTSGVAAAVLDALGPMKPAQLVQYLRNEASFDATLPANRGQALPNNVDGFGALRLRIGGPRTEPFVPGDFDPIAKHLFDTRVTNTVRVGTKPVVRNGAITFNAQGDAFSTADSSRVAVFSVTTSGTLGPGTVQIGPAGWMIPGTTTAITVAAAGQTLTTMAFVPVGRSDEVTISTTAGGHFHVDLLGTFSQNSTYHFGFVPVSSPYRVYNTRTANQPLVAGVARTITVTGAPGSDAAATVPPGARGVMVSLTADTPAATGWLTATSTAVTGTPDFAALPVIGGRASTTTTIVPVDAQGRIRLFSKVNTHLQIDVLGWFGEQLVGGRFQAVQPVRAADTRQGGAAIPPAGAITDVSAAAHGIPVTASAVTGQLFATNATSTGSLRIGRNDAALAGTHREMSISSVSQSYGVGTLTALDAGHARIQTSNAAHRIFDITGWFEPVRLATPGSIVAVPLDPSRPNEIRGSFVVSPDGGTVAYATNNAQVFGINVWHRGTGVTDRFDLDTGSGTPGAVALPAAVSNDGARVVFSSTADNLTADANDGGLQDEFLLDTATKAVRRVNETAGGARVAVVVAVDAAASTVLLQPDPSGSPNQLLSVDLVGGTFTSVGPRPLSGYNPQLTAAVSGTTFWTSRNGGSTVTLALPPDGNLKLISPDGRYLYYERIDSPPNSGPTISAFLYDADTATTVTLCTRLWSGPRIASGGVDWSGGPPPVGNWCANSSPTFDVVNSTGVDPGPWTTDARLPHTADGNSSFETLLSSNAGILLYTSTAANFVTGFDGGTFIYEATAP